MDTAILPKIELHLHLDCSVSYKVAKRFRPELTPEQFRNEFIAPDKCADLVDYINRAVKGFEIMQTREQLRAVTLDVIDQLKADNVIYAEIRFAPLLHIAGGLTPTEVVETVDQAVAEGIAATGVEARLILCTLRHYTEQQSMETVELVHRFKGTHVVGFDIAADEAGFPIDAHIKAFQWAKTMGLHCTAHAGEAKGAESVWETLEHFHPTRIGHGVRSAEDPALLQHLKKNDIHLEVCPTSNIQVNVFDKIENHPADTIYKAGVSMSINCDARTVSFVTLTSEYALMERQFHWTKQHLLHCNLEAIRHCFAEDALKPVLEKKIREGFAA